MKILRIVSILMVALVGGSSSTFGNDSSFREEYMIEVNWCELATNSPKSPKEFTRDDFKVDLLCSKESKSNATFQCKAVSPTYNNDSLPKSLKRETFTATGIMTSESKYGVSSKRPEIIYLIQNDHSVRLEKLTFLSSQSDYTEQVTLKKCRGSWRKKPKELSGTKEGLTRIEVNRVTQDHMKEVRACFDNASKNRPVKNGTIVIKYVINGEGRIKLATTRSNTVNDRDIEECLLSTIKQWKFPMPLGGVDVTVIYPFYLKELML